MKIKLFIIIIVWAFNADAQEVLTLDQAKIITLEHNFGIRIAKNSIQIAENQTEKRANNYWPVVSATGGFNSSLGGSSQKFSNGNEASTSNAFTWGTNASVRADMNLVDKQRDITFEQLKENLTLSNLQLRLTIEQNLFEVYNRYYLIAQLSGNVSALQEAIDISQERLQRAVYQLELGQGSGLNILNARVDIKRDSVNLLNALMEVENEKRNLNVAMGRDVTYEFTIDIDAPTSILVDEQILVQEAMQSNITLQANRQNLTINEIELDRIDAEKQPIISVGAQYDLNFSDNPSGAFIDQSNSRGLAANIGLSWNIFDGSRKIRIDNAVIDLTNQKLQIEEIEQQIERDIINAWANYENAQFVLEVEESAVATNRENFIRTQQQFESGQLSSIDFRQAQLNLLNAQTSLNNASFNAKLMEIQLLQLGGKLID